MPEKQEKILIFDPLPHISGGQRVLLNILPFIQKDFFVTVVVPREGSFKKELEKMGISCVVINPGTYSLVKKNIIQVFKYFFCSIKFFLKVVFIIKKNDLIYVNGARLLPIAVLSNVFFNKPIIFHSHSLITDKKSLSLVELFAKNKNVKKIISVSKFIKSRKSKLSNKTEVIYNGVDTDKFAENKNKNFSNAFEIVVIGDLIPTKGHELLIETLANLKEYNFRLRIIGSSRPGEEKYSVDLKKIIEDNFLKEKIVFLGRRDDINDLLLNSDLLVLPSISAEACPMVVLEAMSCGVPVIASNLGGTSEIVLDGYCGYLFKNKDKLDLELKIKTFLNLGAEDRKKMSENCREEVLKKYSLNLQGNKIYKIITSILNKNENIAS